jgi:hypothetical protein
MDDTDILPVEFLINAQTRLAAQDGVPITVRRRGDEAGTILLKINRLDGTADILTQARVDDKRAWNPAKPDGPMSEADAEGYLARQAEFDPDMWILEIEDRRGRHWFPGRILK